MIDSMKALPTRPSLSRPQRRWSVLSGLRDGARKRRAAVGSLVAMDWDDEQAVLGWVAEPVGVDQAGAREARAIEMDRIELRTHAIPEGLMRDGQWQDASQWLACLERWVAAIPIDHPRLVLALPAKDLSHHWLEGPANLNVDRTDVLMGLVDQAMSEHGRVSLDDPVFDVLSEGDVWPGARMSFADLEAQERTHRWCLVGVAKSRVAALEALFAKSHLSLACLDGRPRALLAAWYPHRSGEGMDCLLDDHLRTTQWMVTSGGGILDMGHWSHQRLSMAERVGHLIERLRLVQASHWFDTIWLSHSRDSELAEVADRVADTLHLSLKFLPENDHHQSSASLEVVVHGLLMGQGLLINPGARGLTHAF